MADYTFVLVGVTMAFIIILILLVRMVKIVQPGEVGLVFALGIYKGGIYPGFNMVAPAASVRRVRVGGGPNKILGMLGRAETELAPDLPVGRVRVGDQTLSARATSRIRPGATIRVIDDVEVGTVLVGAERQRPGGPPIPEFPLS